MKKLITIFFSFICALVLADSNPVPIESPALTGMNSNSDLQERRVTDATYLENANPWAAPGLLRLRYPLKSVGDNNQKVFAAFGYFDFASKAKQVVAVSPKANTDSLIKGFQGGVVTYNTLATDTMAVWLRASNRFETGVQDTTIRIAGFMGAPPYNAVNFDGSLFITSKGNVPAAYSPFTGATSADEKQLDSTQYRPNVLSLGLEAPGQLRVGVLNDPGNKFGTYRYSYGSADSVAYALPSRWVSVDSQDVFLTLFEVPPYLSPDFDVVDSAATWKIEIIRQKYNGPWYRIDTVTVKANQQNVYIDVLADGTSYKSPATVTFLDSDDPVRVVCTTSNAPPGGLRRNVTNEPTGGPFPELQCLDSRCAKRDSTYYFAISYYNPFTGAESPLGPIQRAIVSDSIGSGLDSCFALAFSTGYSKVLERPRWIRLWRGTAGDSTIFYAVAQGRANDFGPLENWTFRPAAGADSQITTGLQTQKTSTTAILYPYVQAQIFQSETGDAFLRPPYIEQLEIGFTDIAYANGRFWGIGDPLFPARVYYSHYDNPYEWSGFGSFAINENESDELVAIEVIPEQEYDFARVVLLKHNSMFELSGYDPEYDLTWRTVDDNKGAISNRTVVSLSGAVYFLSMDMRVYEYRSGSPVEISQPIENYIDTFFTDAVTAGKRAVMFVSQDKVYLSDTANSRALVYVPSRQWWGIEEYPDTCEFIGSFNYNTTRGGFSTDQFDYWLYQGGVGEKFVTEFNYPTVGAIVDSLNGTTSSVRMKYRTPFIGDGQHLYEISQVDISGRWPNGVLRIRIIDGRGVQIDSTGATDAGTNNARLHSVLLPRHEGSYLALEFADQALVQRVEIHSVTLHYRRLGRVAYE